MFKKILSLAASIIIVFTSLSFVDKAAAAVCLIQNGCTGTSTIPANGNLLIGNGTGYSFIASSSLGSSGGGSVTTSSAITQFNFPYWKTTAGGLSGTSTIFYSSSTGFIGINTTTVPDVFTIYQPTGYTSYRTQTAGVTGYFGSNDQFPGINIGSISNHPLVFDVNNTQAGGFASATGLPFYVGNAHKVTMNTNIFGGYLYEQADGTGDNGEDTIHVIQAPAANPQEADLAILMVDPTNSANAKGADFDIECYSASSTFINGTSTAPCVDNYMSIDILKKGTGKLPFFALRRWNQDLGNIANTGVFELQYASSTDSFAVGAYSSSSWNTNNAMSLLTNSGQNHAFQIDETGVGQVFWVNPNGTTFVSNGLTVYGGASTTQYFFALNDGNGGMNLGCYQSSFVNCNFDANRFLFGSRAAGELFQVGTATSTVATTHFGSFTQSSGTVSLASTTINGNGTSTGAFTINSGSDITSTPELSLGSGANASGYGVSFAGGRGMIGFDSTGGNLVLNGGSSKGISLMAGGTNNTFNSGTQGLFIQGNSGNGTVGNVGVNTSTPGSTLTDQGTFLVTGSSTLQGAVNINSPSVTSNVINENGNRYAEFTDFLNATATLGYPIASTTLIISTTTGLNPNGGFVYLNGIEIAQYTSVTSNGTTSLLNGMTRGMFATTKQAGATGTAINAVALVNAVTSSTLPTMFVVCTSASVCTNNFSSSTFNKTIQANPAVTNVQGITFFSSSYGIGIDTTGVVFTALTGRYWEFDDAAGTGNVNGTSTMIIRANSDGGTVEINPISKGAVPANTLDVNGTGDFRTSLAVGTTTSSTAAFFVNGTSAFGGTSSTIKLGTGTSTPGCIESFDNTNGTKYWSYVSSGLWTATSTLPSFCQNI